MSQDDYERGYRDAIAAAARVVDDAGKRQASRAELAHLESGPTWRECRHAVAALGMTHAAILALRPAPVTEGSKP